MFIVGICSLGEARKAYQNQRLGRWSASGSFGGGRGFGGVGFCDARVDTGGSGSLLES